jgi:hypothetical protein
MVSVLLFFLQLKECNPFLPPTEQESKTDGGPGEYYMVLTLEEEEEEITSFQPHQAD